MATVYRVKITPGKFTSQGAKRVIERELGQAVVLHTGVSLTAERDGQQVVISLKDRRSPDILQDRKQLWYKVPGAGSKVHTMIINKDFNGFTVLNNVKPADHKLDVIAITGLGGHAYGSFKERKGSYMWLTVTLPNDLPGARIILYGYESKLAGSKSFQNIGSLGKALISHMDSMEFPGDNNRVPIVFVAQSLGGLIVKDALIEIHKASKREESIKKLMDYIYGALFFGVPSDGMEIKHLIPMVGDQPNLFFLESLGTESQVLEDQARDFRKAFNFKDSSQIVCFYETLKSPTAQKANGKWEMNGKPEILVGRASATHSRNWEQGAGYVYPMYRTHSDLVKFSPGDPDYMVVRKVLKKFMAQAVQVLPRNGEPQSGSADGDGGSEHKHKRKTNNICGNPNCGRTFICWADYMRRTRGY